MNECNYLRLSVGTNNPQYLSNSNLRMDMKVEKTSVYYYSIHLASVNLLDSSLILKYSFALKPTFT